MILRSSEQKCVINIIIVREWRKTSLYIFSWWTNITGNELNITMEEDFLHNQSEKHGAKGKLMAIVSVVIL